jgi:hypothetical protein
MSRCIPALCLLLLASPLWGADSPKAAPATQPAVAKSPATTQPVAAVPAPATQPAAGGAKARALSVTGQAQKSVAAADGTLRWEPLREGDELSERTIIRTGLDSGVLLDLAGRGQVRVGSATKIGISELRVEGSLAKTQLGLKYGTVRAEVDSRTGPADFRVTTPTATLSVRGSGLDASVTNENGTQGFSLHGLLSLNQPGSPGQSTPPGGFVLGSGQPGTQFLFFLHTEALGNPGGMNAWELVTYLENNRGKGPGAESITTGSGIRFGGSVEPPAIIQPPVVNPRQPGFP